MELPLDLLLHEAVYQYSFVSFYFHPKCYHCSKDVINSVYHKMKSKLINTVTVYIVHYILYNNSVVLYIGGYHACSKELAKPLSACCGHV